MMTAVDYSGARFTAAQLKAANIVAVGRYLTGIYAISKAELAEYVGAGISTWFIFEAGVNEIAGGAAQGAADGRKANGALMALGIPVTTPVYFTVDEDVANPQTAVPYFQGIASVRLPVTNGDYAEGELCEVLASDGLTEYHWQTESTGFPGNATTLPITAIQQKYGGAPLGNTDLDILLRSDYGQYPRPATAAPLVLPPLPPPTVYPGDNVTEYPLNVVVSNGKGWEKVPAGVSPSKIISCVAGELDPATTGQYADLPQYAGCAADGTLVFGPGNGGNPANMNGVYSFTLWVAS